MARVSITAAKEEVRQSIEMATKSMERRSGTVGQVKQAHDCQPGNCCLVYLGNFPTYKNTINTLFDKKSYLMLSRKENKQTNNKTNQTNKNK